MQKHLLFIALLFFISCKPTTPSKTSNQNNSSIISDTSSLGTINFTGQIINIYTQSLTICGLPQNNMVSLQIDEIIDSSPSLINKPLKAKTVFFKFSGNTSSLKSGDFIKANAKEYLCKDGVETYFLVTNFEKN